MKSERTIRRHVAQLRKLCEASNDPLEARVAQAMETALRWALNQTAYGIIGSMEEEAKLQVKCLKSEINNLGKEGS